MAEKIISDERRRWLDGELADWQAAGIVSAEQSRSILGLYETTQAAGERKRIQTTFVLQALAALLVGLAALLLIGYNWQALPREVKLAIIFAVLAGTHALGFYLRYRRDARAASEVVFFLGCLFYGAGIWLVAQIYHLDSHYPDGVWWWAVGVLPFALCLETMLAHVLFAGLLALWAGMEVLGFSHLSPWFFGRWGWIPNGAYSLPLLALPGLIWAYRKNSPWAVALYAPLLAWWVILQPVAWHHMENTIWFVGVAGATFLIVAESHRAGSPFAIPYRFWGALLTVGALIPLSFYSFNESVYFSGVGKTSGVTGLLVILGLLGVTLAGAELLRARAVEQSGDAEERGVLRRQWLPVSLALGMGLLALWGWSLAPGRDRFDGPGVGGWDEGARYAALLPTVLANVAIVVFAIWLMRLGVREGRGQPFAAGVACFLLWAVMRYADLFGGMGGMLGAAVMFFLCGAALFALAKFWRERKEVRHG